MIPSVVIGTYEGTGAAINIVIGFKPDFVLVANTEDGDIIGTAWRGLTAAGAGIDIAAAVAANAADALTLTLEATTGEGFTVGTDYSESGKTYGYLALRSGPGAS
jgi:hypothetical protein